MRAAALLLCGCLSLGCGARTARADGGVYVGDYSGEYAFGFQQIGLPQPGLQAGSYSDRAQEVLYWNVRFAVRAGTQRASASLSVHGADHFLVGGAVEQPEDVTCTITARSAPELAPRYFYIQEGGSPAAVDVWAIVPMLTGPRGQVVVQPSSEGPCAGLEATGAAVNCDPFGCGWGCVSFAADPRFDAAWAIFLRDVPLRSFPRTFHASETMMPCSLPGVEYSASRSLKATLAVRLKGRSVRARHKGRTRRARAGAGTWRRSPTLSRR